MPASTANTQRRSSQTALPRSPQLRLRSGGRSCTVSCRHLTPARMRLSWFLAWLSALALVAWPGWYCWSYQHLDVLSRAIDAGGIMLGHPGITFAQRKIVYWVLWACGWLLWPVIAWVFRALFQAALRKRTTLEFTHRWILLRRRFRPSRRYDRTAGVATTFLVRTHPKLAWLQYNARRRGADRLVVLYEQSRVLCIQYGVALYPIACLTDVEESERFASVCQFANSYPLRRVTPLAVGTRLENVADV
jgi:hypothetical protein